MVAANQQGLGDSAESASGAGGGLRRAWRGLSAIVGRLTTEERPSPEMIARVRDIVPTASPEVISMLLQRCGGSLDMAVEILLTHPQLAHSSFGDVPSSFPAPLSPPTAPVAHESSSIHAEAPFSASVPTSTPTPAAPAAVPAALSAQPLPCTPAARSPVPLPEALHTLVPTPERAPGPTPTPVAVSLLTPAAASVPAQEPAHAVAQLPAAHVPPVRARPARRIPGSPLPDVNDGRSPVQVRHDLMLDRCRRRYLTKHGPRAALEAYAAEHEGGEIPR